MAAVHTETILLHRRSVADCFGFTLRHVLIYPPQLHIHDSSSHLEVKDRQSNERGDKLGDDNCFNFETDVCESVDCEAVQVVQASVVHKDSAAHKAGLSAGQRILAINQRPLSALCYEQIIQIIHNSGTSLSLLVVKECKSVSDMSIWHENNANINTTAHNQTHNHTLQLPVPLSYDNAPNFVSNGVGVSHGELPSYMDRDRQVSHRGSLSSAAGSVSASVVSNNRIRALLSEMKTERAAQSGLAVGVAGAVDTDVIRTHTVPRLRSCYSTDNMQLAHANGHGHIHDGTELHCQSAPLNPASYNPLTRNRSSLAVVASSIPPASEPPTYDQWIMRYAPTQMHNAANIHYSLSSCSLTIGPAQSQTVRMNGASKPVSDVPMSAHDYQHLANLQRVTQLVNKFEPYNQRPSTMTQSPRTSAHTETDTDGPGPLTSTANTTSMSVTVDHHSLLTHHPLSHSHSTQSMSSSSEPSLEEDKQSWAVFMRSDIKRIKRSDVTQRADIGLGEEPVSRLATEDKNMTGVHERDSLVQINLGQSLATHRLSRSVDALIEQDKSNGPSACASSSSAREECDWLSAVASTSGTRRPASMAATPAPTTTTVTATANEHLPSAGLLKLNGNTVLDSQGQMRISATKRRSGSHVGIHRFIKLFSNSNSTANAQKTGNSTSSQLPAADSSVNPNKHSLNTAEEATKHTDMGGSKSAIKRRLGDIVAGETDQSPDSAHVTTVHAPITLSAAHIRTQGWIKHAMTALGSHKRDSKWKESYALLAESTLYLCQNAPLTNSQNTDSVVLGAASANALVDQTNRAPSKHQAQQAVPSTVSVRVLDCIVDISYNEPSQAHVLRVTTQSPSELLLALPSAPHMLKWIEQLQLASRFTAGHTTTHTDNTEHNNTTTNTAAGATNGQTNDDASMALIMKRYEAKQQQSSPTARRRQPAKAQTSSMSDTTPKSNRKWKKIKKNNSCPTHESQSQSGAVPNAASSCGAALGLRLADCATDGDQLVPLLVRLCAKVIEAHGIDTVGVYRVPGNTAAVNALMAQLEHGFESVDFTDPRWKDVNVVSSLMKAFFRRLPEPLLTDKLYPIFIDANRIAKHDKRLIKIRYLVRKLPKQNHDTLMFLLTHLCKICQNQGVNKMEARNLALMFGPSIVRASDDSMHTMVTHMSDQCKLIESMIIYCQFIFYSDAEDNQPPAAAENSKGDDQMIQSFSDMTDLLKRVNPPGVDDNEDRSRGFFGQRRTSRKGQSSSRAPDTDTRAEHKSRQNNRRTQSDKPLVHQDINGPFQERDIDAEIAMRQHPDSDGARHSAESDRVLNTNTSSHLLPSTNSESLGVRSAPSQSPVHNPAVGADAVSSRSTDLSAVYAELKRRREQHYLARRVFIAGSANVMANSVYVDQLHSQTSQADAGMSSGASTGSDTQLDELVQHTRHLNVTGVDGRAFDVLSPETREKIRRMQQEVQHNVPMHCITGTEPSRAMYSSHRHPATITPARLTHAHVQNMTNSNGDTSTTNSVQESWPPNNPMADPQSQSQSVSDSAAPRLLSFGVLAHSPATTRSIDTQPWYEADADSADQLVAGTSTAPSITDTTSHLGDDHSPAPSSPSLNEHKQSAIARTLNATERTAARISQKIRFRSSKDPQAASSDRESSEPPSTAASVPVTVPKPSAAKLFVSRLHRRRDDPRRHTLSDVEQIKAALEQQQQDDQHSLTSATQPQPLKQHKSRTHKLRSWLRWGFGKSSPDLTQLGTEPSNTWTGRSGDNTTTTVLHPDSSSTVV